MAQQQRAAAFFDLDKTIIATSSATAFSRPFLAEGLLTRRSMLRAAYAQLAFGMGGADEAQTERLRAQLSRMVTGWDTAQVEAIIRQTLHESIDPTVYAEAVALIGEHRTAGRDVVVVSASGTELVRPIAELVGADDVIVTQTPRAGWAVAADAGETVAIDITVTPELRREGLAREVIRLVQEARKADGLDVTDRIALRWSASDEELAAALIEHASQIAGEVLATEYGAEVATGGAPGHAEPELGLRFWLRRA